MANTETQLALLKVDVGLMHPTKEQEQLLNSKLSAAKARIERRGIRLKDEDPDCNDLVVMYAAWLYRKRAQSSDETEMPRMLKQALNDVLVSQKMGGST